MTPSRTSALVRRPRRAALALLLALATSSAACGTEPLAATAQARPTQSPSAASADAQRDLATLRASTARFHRYDVARDAGYTFLFMNMCMVDQSPAARGGMGLHYVNTALLDGSVSVTQPEALLYEPQPNGRLRLVAAEYVIPESAWNGAEPPVLFGRSFTLNPFGLWALHVWAWEQNPSGMFADWNPRVSCDGAAAAAAMPGD